MPWLRPTAKYISSAHTAKQGHMQHMPKELLQRLANTTAHVKALNPMPPKKKAANVGMMMKNAQHPRLLAILFEHVSRIARPPYGTRPINPRPKTVPGSSSPKASDMESYSYWLAAVMQYDGYISDPCGA